jgi:N-acetylmuramoyl-L-alanine amidase
MTLDLRRWGAVAALTILGAVALAAPSSLRAAGPISVSIDYDSTEDSTRLVLTHSDPVSYAIESTRGRLKIVYTEPVEITPRQQRVGSPILERYRMRDNRTLLLYTGRAFGRYESFELRNPFRLVLDLQARKSGRNAGSVSGEKRQDERTIIVIDPGHGGVEDGAVGRSGLREKDVTLDLARRLRQSLRAADANINVVLTRDEDRLVGLDERTAIANHNKADLFFSIHVNAAPRSSAKGAETYYLSATATDDEARNAAALENRSPSGTSSIDTSGLEMVLWDLAQNQHLAASSALAESMQRHLNELCGTRDRGVKQAPFRVLMGATMPAVLVEVGFITNEGEEEKLQTPEYRDQIVDAMVGAVQDFLFNLDLVSAPSREGAVGAGSP